MSEYKQYRRKQIAELADWTTGMDMAGVSISDADKANGSPKAGDKIARNPKNHADRWLVAADYFAENFEAAASPEQAALVTFCPADGDPCRKACDTVCERTGGKTGRIPWAAPEQAVVSVPREQAEKVINELCGRKGFDAAWDECDDDIREEIVTTIAGLLAAAPAPSVTEAQIGDLARDCWISAGSEVENSARHVEQACREVLALAGVRVK